MGVRSSRQFDRKFGADAFGNAPSGPGVYLFRDAGGDVVYVGKAASLRRRIARYRNATRKKRDRKPAAIVRHAASLEWRTTDSERDALLLENQLIQRHRPSFNVAGAFWFTYPVIGMGRDDRYLSLCLTSAPDDVTEAWPALALTWFGSYRNRDTTATGLFAIADLLSRLGHREKRPVVDRQFAPIRNATLIRIRRAPDGIEADLSRLWLGRSQQVLRTIATALLESAAACRDAAQVQVELDAARAFFADEAARLHELRRRANDRRPFVPQHERDRLQILADFSHAA